MTAKTSLIAAAGLALGMAAFSQIALAGTDLRCGNRLINPGDSMYEVRTLCGPPDAVQQRVERRAVRRRVVVPCAIGLCQQEVEDSVEVPIEEWTYDFGRKRFIQFLTFVDGKLARVKSGDYGLKQ